MAMTTLTPATGTAEGNGLAAHLRRTGISEINLCGGRSRIRC